MNVKFTRSNYRHLVVGVDTEVPLANGQYVTAINFDNAATTPPFTSVLHEIMRFSNLYSSIHRGTGYKSRISSQLYEEARSIVIKFVNANPLEDTVIFVKNTTEAINKLAYRLWDRNKKRVILSTEMEHHSNDLPWRDKFQVDYVQTDPQGRLNLEDLERKLIKHRQKVELVTVTGASNVTGYVNSIHKIAELAHRYHAKILVDGAQLVPHSLMDMNPKNPHQRIDYLVFSAHKMYAPFGTGVLIGPQESFNQGAPEFVGGGTVQMVTHDWVTWDTPPYKEEAGTPNIMGVVALITAIKTLSALGMATIEQYERQLHEYALSRLRSIPGITLYTQYASSEPRIGVIPFNIDGIGHDVVATMLSTEAGIAVRNGCFCAQPYIQKLLQISPKEMERLHKMVDIPRPGMVRLSFGLYNDVSEIDVLILKLARIIEQQKHGIRRSAPFNIGKI